MTLTPTQEQHDILNAVRSMSRGDTLCVNAYAGTGKTSTLRMVAEDMKAADPSVRILYLVYNKLNQLESQAKFGRLATVLTAHSLAFRNMPYRFEVDKFGIKLTDIKQRMENTTTYSTRELWLLSKMIKATVELYCISPCIDVSRECIPPDFKAMCTAKKKDDKYDDYCDTIVQQAAFFIKQIRESKKFTHAFYLKEFSLLNVDLGKMYDVILFDEAQDANPPMLEMVMNSNVKRVFVGDVYQHIYGFTGARNFLRDVPSLPLSGTFRFGSAIADIVCKYIKSVAEKDISITGLNACEGIVLYTDKQLDELQSSGKQLCVICRYNTTIVREALKALRNGKTIAINGFDTLLQGPLQDMKDLFTIVNKPTKSIRDVTDNVMFQAFESVDELRMYADVTYDVTLSNMLAFVDNYKGDLIADIDRVAREVRDSGEANVTFVSAHKSKGFEFDNVMLSGDFIPDKSAPSYITSDAELNLVYVACTRAKQSLYIPEAIYDDITRGIKGKYAEHITAVVQRRLKTLGGSSVVQKFNERKMSIGRSKVIDMLDLSGDLFYEEVETWLDAQ